MKFNDVAWCKKRANLTIFSITIYWTQSEIKVEISDRSCMAQSYRIALCWSVLKVDKTRLQEHFSGRENQWPIPIRCCTILRWFRKVFFNVSHTTARRKQWTDVYPICYDGQNFRTKVWIITTSRIPQ